MNWNTVDKIVKNKNPLQSTADFIVKNLEYQLSNEK